MRIGKFTFRVAQAGEIKPQNRNSHRRQTPGDPARGWDVFGAGKAMRKERRGQMRAFGQIKAGGKPLSAMSGK